MAFGSQKANTRASLILAAFLVAGPVRAAELQFSVRHDHLWKSGAGTLTFSEDGVLYREQPGKPGADSKDLHRGSWKYEDIQQLYLAPKKVSIRSYDDRRWLLGADRELELTLDGDQTFEAAYDFLKTRLDQRFVAAFADREQAALWEVPVKLKGLISGSQGVLRIGPDRVVYRTSDREESRTWRYGDIESISSSGPFQLTLTTWEKSGRDYGDRRAFNFQLKRPLNQKLYNDLWRRLNQTTDIDLITSIQTEEPKQ
jgi:hypothetical protein